MKVYVFATVLFLITFSLQSAAQPIKPDTLALEAALPYRPSVKKLYMDVHHLGAGNVTADALKGAHKKDLAVEKKYGVNIMKYYFDEKNGNVYCLASAASAEALRITHKTAHGLMPDQVYEVSAGEEAALKGKNKLYLDVHELGAGAVTAKDVAGAHQRDLAVQKKHRVNLINYFLDEKKGTVLCLAQAPNADSLINTHREAHGLLPSKVTRVKEGH